MVGVASSNLVAPTKFGRIKNPDTKQFVSGFLHLGYRFQPRCPALGADALKST
jgi:hypothetical protein